MSSDIWLSIVRGDEKAYLIFYKENYQRLYGYGYRLTGDKELVKDSIQELFLQLWRSRLTINSQVDNTLSYLMTWLRRIIIKQQTIRSKDRLSINIENVELSYEQLLINQQSGEERNQKLNAALKMLTPTQLKILQARFYEDKSYDMIASEQKMAKQSIYNIIHKVIGILHESMKSPACNLVFYFLFFEAY